jgi:hypothetical protein
MAVQVTIDAGSRGDAEVIAAVLPGEPQAASWRGYGVVRLRLRKPEDVHGLVPILEGCVKRHRLAWARLRFGDDEWMFRGERRRSAP